MSTNNISNADDSVETPDYWLKRAAVQEHIENGGRFLHDHDYKLLPPSELNQRRFSRVLVQSKSSTTISLIKILFDPNDIEPPKANFERSFFLNLQNIKPSKNHLYTKQYDKEIKVIPDDGIMGKQMNAKQILEFIEKVHNARSFVGALEKNSVNLPSKIATFVYFSVEEARFVKEFFAAFPDLNIYCMSPTRLKFTLSLPSDFDVKKALLSKDSSVSFLQRTDDSVMKILRERTTTLEFISWILIHSYGAVVNTKGAPKADSDRSTSFSTRNIATEKLKEALFDIRKNYSISTEIDQQDHRNFIVKFNQKVEKPSRSSLILQNNNNKEKTENMENSLTNLKSKVLSFIREKGFGAPKDYVSVLPFNNDVRVSASTPESVKKIFKVLEENGGNPSILKEGQKVIHISKLGDIDCTSTASAPKNAAVKKADPKKTAVKKVAGKKLGKKFDASASILDRLSAVLTPEEKIVFGAGSASVNDVVAKIAEHFKFVPLKNCNFLADNIFATPEQVIKKVK